MSYAQEPRKNGLVAGVALSTLSFDDHIPLEDERLDEDGSETPALSDGDVDAMADTERTPRV